MDFLKLQKLLIAPLTAAVLIAGCGKGTDKSKAPSAETAPPAVTEEIKTTVNITGDGIFDGIELEAAEDDTYTVMPRPSEKAAETAEENHVSIAYSQAAGADEVSQGETDRYNTSEIPAGKPEPVEPQEAEITDTELTCYLTVRCDTILDNMADLKPEKTSLVPSDGIIYPRRKVVFYEGESVFNVFVREMKKNKIHFEYTDTPMYNSAYIEGINNLYEFDCGSNSGWMYKVNDWIPNYGVSRYELHKDDEVVFVYTCDNGRDIVNE